MRFLKSTSFEPNNLKANLKNSVEISTLFFEKLLTTYVSKRSDLFFFGDGSASNTSLLLDRFFLPANSSLVGDFLGAANNFLKSISLIDDSLFGNSVMKSNYGDHKRRDFSWGNFLGFHFLLF